MWRDPTCNVYGVQMFMRLLVSEARAQAHAEGPHKWLTPGPQQSPFQPALVITLTVCGTNYPVKDRTMAARSSGTAWRWHVCSRAGHTQRPPVTSEAKSSEDDNATCSQAISNYRATLSGTRSSNALQNDDQWITNTATNTPVLVPSNGYTFERTDWQARRS